MLYFLFCICLYMFCIFFFVFYMVAVNTTVVNKQINRDAYRCVLIYISLFRKKFLMYFVKELINKKKFFLERKATLKS